MSAVLLAQACAPQRSTAPMEVAPLRVTSESGIAEAATSDASTTREPRIARTRIEAGEYLGVLRTRVTGPFYFRLVVEQDGTGEADDTFEAHTPRGVAWSLIGGVEGAVGSLFAPFLFPGGSILTWESSQPRRTGESASEERDGTGTIGVGTRSSLRVGTRTRLRDLVTEVVLRDGRTIGMIELIDPQDAQHAPRTDYSRLARGVARAIREHLYDARLVESSPYRSFAAEFERRADAANDDLEFLLGLGLAARRHLRNAPPIVYRPGPDERALEILAGSDGAKLARVWRDESSGVVVLRIDAFLDEEETLRSLREALSHEPSSLVLDLRTCIGGDLSSLHVLAALMDRTTDAGMYVGRDATQESEPIVVEFTGKHGAATLVPSSMQRTRVLVAPAAPTYSGRVIVLVSKRTGSTAESLALVLQRSGRAKVYGERTPGLMRLTREFDAGQGWVVRIGAYDYIAPGEERPRRDPVTPDSTTSAARALPEALMALGVSKEVAEEHARRERGSARPVTDTPR